MQNIVSTLKMLIFPTIINNISEEKEINHSEKCEATSESIKGTMDLNNELISNGVLNISDISDLSSKNKKSQSVILNTENSLSNISIQTALSNISYGSTFDKINYSYK